MADLHWGKEIAGCVPGPTTQGMRQINEEYENA